LHVGAPGRDGQGEDVVLHRHAPGGPTVRGEGGGPVRRIAGRVEVHRVVGDRDPVDPVCRQLGHPGDGDRDGAPDGDVVPNDDVVGGDADAVVVIARHAGVIDDVAVAQTVLHVLDRVRVLGRELDQAVGRVARHDDVRV